MSTRLYVEGGGDSKALRRSCARGFRLFLEKAGLAGRMPGIVACGSRQDAYDRFATAIGAGGEPPLLLVDVESPFTARDPWTHLNARDGWRRPDGATRDQCHLMVEVMESWFLADRGALEAYYGQKFRGSALPGNPDVEKVAKADVYSALANASRDTQKGAYEKGRDGFAILERIQPSRVEKGAREGRRFLAALRARS